MASAFLFYLIEFLSIKNWILSLEKMSNTIVFSENQTPLPRGRGVWCPQLPHGFARRAQTIINLKGSCGTYESIIY
jgi:hypothetical protein